MTTALHLGQETRPGGCGILAANGRPYALYWWRIVGRELAPAEKC